MEILYRYHNKPTNNFLCTDGTSRSVTLFDNGIVWYERFLFCCEEPAEHRVFGPVPELVDAVSSIIDAHSEEIASFPEFIDNNVCDGSWQYLRFKEKEIIVDNMMFSTNDDIERIYLLHDDDEVEKIMIPTMQTNTLYRICQKITAAFIHAFPYV